jgi:putative heme transporter
VSSDHSHWWWHLPHRRLTGAKRRRHHRAVEIFVIVLILGWVGWGLSHMDAPSLRLRYPILLVLAVGFEVGSMASFARVQRLALAAGGVRIPLREAMRITYASNAVSVTVPVAGSAAATANTVTEYSHQGADSGLIAWTLMITGIISTVAFALLTAIGAIVSGNGVAALAGITATAIGTLPVVGVLLSVRHPASRAKVVRAFSSFLHAVSKVVRRPKEPDATAARVIEQLGSYHLTRFATAKVLLFATTNWLLDAACLSATIAAFGQPVPWRFMFAIYAAGVGAAAVGFTPAGIGIVEAALASALTKGGLASARAFPTALTYRAISCWLVLAIGWFLFARSRSHLDEPHDHHGETMGGVFSDDAS